MRLNNGEAVETDSIGDVKVIKGGISEQSIHLLVDMLSNQMYSNPIGSIVRELTSNCFDAHAELHKVTGTEVEDAVIVRYTEEEGLGFISFIDSGIGMNPERVEKVYLRLLESSKRDTDDLIGGFGVGGKSFLSYTDSVTLITRSDGIEYYYIVGKNDEGEFGAWLLDTKETTEKNGSEVKMAIGKVPYFQKAADFPNFQKEIKKQLYYFDNVYVDGFDLDNEYQLFEGDHFKFRTGWDSPFSEMHLTLGKVAYPLNWKTLEREPINLPIAIKFDIGELSVTINREELRYIGSTKEIINNRIDTALEEIKILYNKQVTSVDTLEEYFEAVNADKKYLIFKDLNGDPHDLVLPTKIGWNEKNEKVIVDVIKGLENPKYSPFAHLPITIPKDPFFPFYIKGVITEVYPKKDSLILELDEKKYTKNTFKAVSRLEGSVYRLKGERTRTLDKYLFWKQQEDKKHPPVLLSIRKLSYKLWCEYLGLGKEVKRNVNTIVWFRDYHEIPDKDTGEVVRVSFKNHSYEQKRVTINEPTDLSITNKAKIIKEYKRLIIKELAARTDSYDNQVLSSQYLAHLELQKVINKRPKLEGFISINNILTGNGSDRLDLSTLNNFKGYIVYGERSQAKEVRNIMELLRACGRRTKYNKEVFIHKFFVTGKNNFSSLLDNPYFMSVEDFMSGHNRLFKNAVTAWYIRTQIKSLKSNYSYFYGNLELFNKSLAKLEEDLDTWSNKEVSRYTDLDDSFMDTLLMIGKENHLLHEDKIEQIDRIVKWFEGTRHLGLLDSKMFVSVEFKKDLVLILKSRGKRLGNEHYLQKPIVIPTIFEVEQLELELPEILIDEEIETEQEDETSIEGNSSEEFEEGEEIY